MKANAIPLATRTRLKETRTRRDVLRDTAKVAPLLAAILKKFRNVPPEIYAAAARVVDYAGDPLALSELAKWSKGRVLTRAKRNGVRLNESLVLLALLHGRDAHTMRDRSPLAGLGFAHVSLGYIAEKVEVLAGRRLSISAIDRTRQTLKAAGIMEAAIDPSIPPEIRRQKKRTRREVTRKRRRAVRDTVKAAPLLAAILKKFRNVPPEIYAAAARVVDYAGDPLALSELAECAGDRDSRKRAKRKSVRLNESLVLLALLHGRDALTMCDGSPLAGLGFAHVPMVWISERVEAMTGRRLSERGLSRTVRTLKAAGIYH